MRLFAAEERDGEAIPVNHKTKKAAVSVIRAADNIGGSVKKSPSIPVPAMKARGSDHVTAQRETAVFHSGLFFLPIRPLPVRYRAALRILFL